jgi:hypothetical protein
MLAIVALSASIAIGAVTSEEELRDGDARAAQITVQDAYFAATERAETHLRQAVSQRFDKICTFNGYLADGEWLRSDLHPCIERGAVRIWRQEENTRNGTLVHYSAGRINGDGSVTTAINYYPSYGTRIFADPYRNDFKADAAVVVPMADMLAAEFPIPAETASSEQTKGERQ